MSLSPSKGGTKLFTKLFVQAAAERALKTIAQFLLTALIGQAVTSIDWTLALEGAGVAGVLSVLTSVVSATTNPAGSPSLVEAPPTGPVVDGGV
jgi:hypothetical protein